MGLAGLRPSTRKDDQLKSSKRKLDKKLNLIAKITEAAASLGAKKTIVKKKRLRSRQKKLKAYNLSALSECLPDVAPKNSAKTPVFKLNCKNRQKLVVQETEAMNALRNDPEFQADPFLYIRRRLEERLPPPPPAEKSWKKKGTRNRRKSKKTAGLQSMEMQHS